MSDLKNRVEIEVAANATQANKVLEGMPKKAKQEGDKLVKQMGQAQERWLKVAEDGLRKYGGAVGGVFADIIQQYDKVKKAMDASKGMGAVGKAGIGAGIVGGALAGAMALTKVLSDAAEHTKEVQKAVVEYQTLKKVVDSISDPIERAAYLTKTLGANASEKYSELAKKGKEAMWELENTKVWSTLTLQSEEFWKKNGLRIKSAAKEGFAMFANVMSLGAISKEDIALSQEQIKAKITQLALEKQTADLKAKNLKDAKTLNDIAKLQAADDNKKMEELLKQEAKVLFLKWQETKELEDQLKYEQAISELKKVREKRKEDERQKGKEEVDKLTTKDPITGKSQYDRANMSDKEILQAESDRLRDSTLSPSEIALRNSGVSLINGSVMSKKDRDKTLGTKAVRDLQTRSDEIGKLKSFKRVLDPASRYEQNKKNMERASLLEQMAKAFVENGNAHPVKPLNGK